VFSDPRNPESFRLNLGVDETAAALGVSARTVRSLIARNELPVVRIGRRVLIRVERLDEFVRSLEGKTAR